MGSLVVLLKIFSLFCKVLVILYGPSTYVAYVVSDLFAAQVMSQFPAGFNAGNLPGFAAAAANFANFRPQYSVPGQPTPGFPGKTT